MEGSRYRRFWLAIGWAMVGLVVFMSLAPSSPEIIAGIGDKVGHFISYLTLMFWFGLVYTKGRSHVLLACSFILMGIALESIQHLTNFRTFEVLDILANTSGVMVGWALSGAYPECKGHWKA